MVAISLEGQEVNTSKPLLQAAKTIRAALAFTLEVLASDSEDHIGIKAADCIAQRCPPHLHQKPQSVRVRCALPYWHCALPQERREIPSFPPFLIDKL